MDKILTTRSSPPYDAEIEYLESTGTQYIDTGIPAHSNIGYRINGILLSTSTETFPVLIGIQDRNDTWYYEVYGSNVQSTEPLLVNEGWQSTDVYSIYGYVNIRTTATFNYLSDGLATINPSQSSSTSSQINWQQFVEHDINICIFAAGSDNQQGYIYNSNSRVYSCQISDGSTIVRDFIPVRCGQIGYLYDKITNQLFGNGGTDNFILGDDISVIKKEKTLNTRIKNRYDMEENWLTENPILLSGETAFTDISGIHKCKVGDGETPYTGLPYVNNMDEAMIIRKWRD